MPAPADLPFRIVSVGLEGESVLVANSVGRDGNRQGEEAAADRRRRDAISTSTLPFGASSLPTLAPPCRQELQDRCGMSEKIPVYATSSDTSAALVVVLFC